MPTRGTCLPLEQRLYLYDEVLQLRRLGLSHSQIVETIYRFHGVRLHRSNISFWERKLHHPLGKVNKFRAKPSRELAGVIGAILSDGNLYKRKNIARRIWLSVKDKDYAEAFGHALAKVLGKENPYKPRWSKGQERWITEAGSILLYRFLQRPWHEFKPHIEHCKQCVAAFLRMFFDGEGSISARNLRVYNTNKTLLLYIKKLLRQFFSIEATEPHEGTKKGYRMHDPRSGKIYEANKTCYYLQIRADSLSRFHQHIGFTIKRKQRRLTKAIGGLSHYLSFRESSLWPR